MASKSPGLNYGMNYARGPRSERNPWTVSCFSFSMITACYMNSGYGIAVPHAYVEGKATEGPGNSYEVIVVCNLRTQLEAASAACKKCCQHGGPYPVWVVGTPWRLTFRASKMVPTCRNLPCILMLRPWPPGSLYTYYIPYSRIPLKGLRAHIRAHTSNFRHES